MPDAWLPAWLSGGVVPMETGPNRRKPNEKLRYDQLYNFLTNPTLRYRLARHGLMWSATLFLIYRRFEYNSIHLGSPADQKTTWFSTLFFGELTILAYTLITFLLRELVLRRSQITLLAVRLVGVHLLIYALSMFTPAKTPDAITKLSSLMRYALYGTEASLVPLEGEIEFLRDYVDLQAMRQEADADLAFEVHGAFQGFAIAPLLLITFVENAFKHGAQDSLPSTLIHIDLTVDQGALTLNVVNDVPDLRPKKESGDGIGYRNAKRRLDLFYPERHSLTAHCRDGQYFLNLKIDLHGNALPRDRRG